MSLIDEVQQAIGSGEVNQISQHLGIDPTKAQAAVSAAVPMIVGGMAGHASQPGGEADVQQAVNNHAGAADSIAQLIQTGPPADGAMGLLGGIFGSHGSSVEQGVQQASGLDSSQTRRLLMMLAPIVLGIIAKRRSNQPTAGGLGGSLQQEAQNAASRSPHVGGLLGKILNAAQSHSR